MIAFSETVARAIERYLDLRDDRSGPLFQTRQGARMRPQGLVVLFQRLSKTTGISHIHAHRFRHSFATMAIRAAAGEIDVQHLLGHSTSAMVRRYSRTYDAEQAANAHARFSPVAGLQLPPPPGRVSSPIAIESSPPTRTQNQSTAFGDRKLTRGTQLIAFYKGKVHTAEVVDSEEGRRFRLEDGQEFASLSAAGRAVMGGVACNGWRFWSIAGEEAQRSSRDDTNAPTAIRPA